MKTYEATTIEQDDTFPLKRVFTKDERDAMMNKFYKEIFEPTETFTRISIIDEERHRK